MIDHILVTGGTGTTGRKVAQLLKNDGLNAFVGTRTPASSDHRLFNWAAPSTATAFEGCRAAYLVAPTDRTDHLAIMQPMLERAMELGTRRFVLLSSSQLEPGGPMMGAVHAWLASNAQEWAVLRPSWFMQNFSTGQHARTISEEGAIYSATGAGRVGFIDANDIAATACALLTAKQPLNDEALLTGPEALSYDDIADIISQNTGRKVRHECLDGEALTKRFIEEGMPQDYAATLASLDDIIRSGGENRVTAGVEKFTGNMPRSFQTFIGNVVERT